MAFVADDLVAWLIGVFADAGRKKLTAVLLGTEQERALRSAAIAAVRQTAKELSPDDDVQAERVALVISQVFGEPVPDVRPDNHKTVLEALQVGITAQLAVIDATDLTETEQSAADVLGVSGAVLAEKLTGYLLREIVVRGSRGGPLFPLASQLNDDVTHLQGMRIEGMIGRLAEDLREALARLDNDRASKRSDSVRNRTSAGPIKARGWRITHPDGSITIAEIVKVTTDNLAELAKRSPEGTVLSAGDSLKDFVFLISIPLKNVFPMEEDFERLAAQVLLVLRVSGALDNADEVYLEVRRLYRMMNSVAHGHRISETEAREYGAAAIKVGQLLLNAFQRVPPEWFDPTV